MFTEQLEIQRVGGRFRLMAAKLNKNSGKQTQNCTQIKWVRVKEIYTGRETHTHRDEQKQNQNQFNGRVHMCTVHQCTSQH